MELSSSPIMQVKELPAKRGVQFIDLKQSNNRVIASALTNLFLINYLDFINAKVSMSDEQCIDTVEIIIDEYPYMTTDSIKTFFRQCKMGRFGEVYGSIDGAKILSWLRKFNEDLDRSIDNYEYQQHVNSINNTNTDNLLSQILRVS